MDKISTHAYKDVYKVIGEVVFTYYDNIMDNFSLKFIRS